MSADLLAEFGTGSSSTHVSGHPDREIETLQTDSLIPGLEVSKGPSSDNPQVKLSTREEPQCSSNAQRQSDNTVLFDACLETCSNDGSEEWGAFESAGTLSALKEPALLSQATARAPNLIDALLIKDNDPSADSTPTWQMAGGIGPKAVQARMDTTAPINRVTKDECFDDWSEFMIGQSSEPSMQMNSREMKEGKSTTNEKFKLSMEVPTKPESRRSTPTRKYMESNPMAEIRPTNIPPPSVLLQMFPRLFEQLQQNAARVKEGTKRDSIPHSAALYIANALKTAARVIAGRTWRWKRDSILSQNMKIGPARSGKSGGMKLNTVNRNENIKEQQEAAEVLQIWRDLAALFNSALQAAGERPVPVIAENTRIVTAASNQGAIKAPHACALCGLKRDERLPKIDDKVEDSFGEWWTDHWGHTDCKQFWKTNRNLLDQR